jgi:hypothetical protein
LIWLSKIMKRPCMEHTGCPITNGSAQLSP